MMSRRINKAHLFGAVLLLGLLAFTARPATDPDLWWHLRTGQWMVQNHQIPRADPFSFTRTGAPWVSHEWLSELLFLGLWRFTGTAGLIIFSAIVTTIGFMHLFWRCLAPPHWAVAVTVLGALASAPTWGVRPQMFTFALASLWLWLLQRSEQRLWLLLWLPPLFLLWLNLHAGFALGPALLIAYGIGLIWEVATGDTQWRVVRPHALSLLLALTACFALVPLNPSGTQLYRYPLDVLRSGTMRSFIVEWHSPDFHQQLFFPLLLLNLALLITLALPPVRPPARILLPLFGTFFAALDAVRHIPIFVLVAVPVIASALPDQPHFWQPPLSMGRRFGVALATAVLIMMGFFTAAQWIRLARKQSSNEARMYPARAVDHLASLQSPNRLFAYYDWGGYSLWRLYPECRLFVDGRADLYGPDLLLQFQEVMQLRPSWRQILDTWEVESILIPPTSALAQSLSIDPSWRLEYWDSQAILFLRGHQPVRQTPERRSAWQPGSTRQVRNISRTVKKSFPELT